MTSKHAFIHQKDLKTQTLKVIPVPKAATAYGRHLRIQSGKPLHCTYKKGF